MSWTSWPDEYEKIVNRIENDKYKPTTLDEQHLAEKAYKRLNVFWKLQLAAVVVTVMTMLTEITLSVYVYNPQALSTTVVVLGVQTTGIGIIATIDRPTRRKAIAGNSLLIVANILGLSLLRNTV